MFLEPGSPREDGYGEGSNGKLRDESLDREVFGALLEAKVLIERWRRESNGVRPHGMDFPTNGERPDQSVSSS